MPSSDDYRRLQRRIVVVLEALRAGCPDCPDRGLLCA